MAQKGAKNVVGVDISKRKIDFANKNLKCNYSQLKEIIKFKHNELSDLEDNINFDIIISKDSFEHIHQLDVVVFEIKRRLKTKGKVYIGFSPLYKAFDGDHGYYGINILDKYKIRIPWGHIIHDYINDTEIPHLNKLSYEEYKKILCGSGMNVEYFAVNQSNKSRILKIFSFLRKFKKLKEYFTYNLYCILEKK